MSDSGYYRLEELDGTHLKASFAGNRLKSFFTRREREETSMRTDPDVDAEVEEDSDDD